MIAARALPAANAADVAAPFAVHGGRLALARATFGWHGDGLDLSTGIAPWAYPATIDARDLETLPDPAALAGLEAAAAAMFGSDPATTIAVPGTDLALRLLGHLLAAKSPAVVGPGYSGHVTMWPVAPAIITAAAIAACDHDAIILARPNNPDGAIVDAATLAAARCRWLIVDEAFADGPVTATPNRITLRSFGKFFGLPGLRLGFVIAPEPLAGAIRHNLGDWPVSGPALAIATAAYRDREWYAAQRTRLATAAARLDSLLAAAGLTVIGGTSCFRLIETPDAAALFTDLAENRILTRPFLPTRLRLGLPGTEGQWAHLRDSLETRPR